MSYIIKKINRDNAKYVANITTVSWNQTYKGIVDDSFLKYLKDTEDERCKHILSNLENNNTYLIDVDGKYVGFIKYTNTDYFKDTCGEIKCLYLINGYKGYGYGRILFDFAYNELKKEGYNKFIVSCLEGNKANYFYIHMGGKMIGSRNALFGDINYKENIYLFDIL